MSIENPALAAALEYASRGWRVFPCKPASKEPLLKGWPDKATTDADTIRGWWAATPLANVAIATGQGSGFFALDVDTKADAKGAESLKTLTDQNGELPETVTALTGGGGRHVFFVLPEGRMIGNRAGVLPGLDVRGDRGYVLVAPSIHPNTGKAYELTAFRHGTRKPWEREAAQIRLPLAPAPAWLLDLIAPIVTATDERPLPPLESARKIEPIARQPETGQGTRVIERARLYLQECEPAVQGQGGHGKLLWAARALVVGFELPVQTAISLLWSDFNPRCVPPWNPSLPSEVKDFERKAHEAHRTPGSKPRGWLLDECGLRGHDEAELAYGMRLASGLLASGGVDEDTEGAEDAGVRRPVCCDADLPDEMFTPPGFIGEFVRYAGEQAPYPNKPLAFAGALATLSLLAGRKYRSVQGVRPNLYVAVLAESGAGKEFPRGMIDRLAVAAGFAHMVGNRFASGEGVEDVLRETPAYLFKIDEVDSLLRPMGKAGDSLVENMVAMLLSLYGESSGVHICRAKAGQSAAERMAVESPNLVLFGTAIPKNFYAALEERVVTSGLLSRFLVLDVKRPRIGQDTAESDLPPSLVEAGTWLARFWPAGDGKRGDIATARNPVPLVVKSTTAGDDILRAFRAECDGQAIKAVDDGDSVLNAVSVRSYERASKLALLYAISADHERPEIGADAARWGVRLERFCSGRLLAAYGRYGAATEFEKSCRRIEEHLSASERGAATRSQLMRLTRFPVKQFDEIMRTLIERKTVKVDEGATKGRPAIVYRLKKLRE